MAHRRAVRLNVDRRRTVASERALLPDADASCAQSSSAVIGSVYLPPSNKKCLLKSQFQAKRWETDVVEYDACRIYLGVQDRNCEEKASARFD